MTIDLPKTDCALLEGPPPLQDTKRTYIVVLHRHIQVADMTRLLHYVSDFGIGDARGLAHDGGWCVRLSEMADVRLLTSQCGDLVQNLLVQEGSVR